MRSAVCRLAIIASLCAAGSARAADWSDGLLELEDGERAELVARHLENPAVVSWPAGTHSLAHLLERCAAEGNDTLLELGLDTGLTATFDEAFSGSYWEGILMLCDAFDLCIVGQDGPSRTPPGHQPGPILIRVNANGSIRGKEDLVRINGGPLMLAGKSSPSATRAKAQASGPFVLLPLDLRRREARLLSGHHHWLEAEYMVIAEPRFPIDMVPDAQLVWAEATGDDQTPLEIGRPEQLPLLQGPTSQGPRRPPPRSTTKQAKLVAVRGLQSDTATVHLSGTLTTVARLPWTESSRLKPDENKALKVDEAGQVQVYLVSSTGAERGEGFPAADRRRGNTAVIVYPDDIFQSVPRLNVELIEGVPLALRGSFSDRTDDDRRVQGFYLPELELDSFYTVTVSGAIRLEEFSTPVELKMDVP